MPSPGDLAYNRALDATERGDAATALSETEECLMHNPEDSEAWQLYVMLLTQLGRVEDAEKAREKWQNLGGSDYQALLLKAHEAANSNEWNRAVSACEDALEVNADDAGGWALYANCLFSGNYRDDALEAIEKAIALESEFAMHWYLKARFLRLMNKSDAMAAYDKAVVLNEEFALAWYEKGMVHYEQQQTSEARSCFEKAKSLKFEDPGLEKAFELLSQ